MKTKKVVIFFFASLLFVSGIQLFSCKRPAPPKAVITVVDENNVPVEGATVIVRADNGRVIYLKNGMVLQDTAKTDANGQVSYEFMYEAIYNVKATKLKTSNAGVDRSGTGVLILKEDETYEEKVKIRP